VVVLVSISVLTVSQGRRWRVSDQLSSKLLDQV
jgi:hypothetical protein